MDSSAIRSVTAPVSFMSTFLFYVPLNSKNFRKTSLVTSLLIKISNFMHAA